MLPPFSFPISTETLIQVSTKIHHHLYPILTTIQFPALHNLNNHLCSLFSHSQPTPALLITPLLHGRHRSPRSSLLLSSICTFQSSHELLAALAITQSSWDTLIPTISKSDFFPPPFLDMTSQCSEFLRAHLLYTFPGQFCPLVSKANYAEDSSLYEISPGLSLKLQIHLSSYLIAPFH